MHGQARIRLRATSVRSPSSGQLAKSTGDEGRLVIIRMCGCQKDFGSPSSFTLVHQYSHTADREDDKAGLCQRLRSTGSMFPIDKCPAAARSEQLRRQKCPALDLGFNSAARLRSHCAACRGDMNE